MKTKTTLWISATMTAVLLVGCGGSSESTTDMALQTGYLIDSPVSNVDYDCLADGDMNKTTGPNGEFQCREMKQVRFRIGELVLGQMDIVPDDKKVFLQDLVKVERNDMNNPQLIELAQLLQSLDADKNLNNGIHIPDEIKNNLGKFKGTFGHDFTQAEELLDEIKDDHDLEIVDENAAHEHLAETYRKEHEDDQDQGGNYNDDGHGNSQGGQDNMHDDDSQNGQGDIHGNDGKDDQEGPDHENENS